MPGDRELLGQTMTFKNATEPTDIIWENRHYTAWDYQKRSCMAMMCVAFLLFLSFLLIFAISTYSAKIANVFPPVECSGIVKAYEGDLLRDFAV